MLHWRSPTRTRSLAAPGGTAVFFARGNRDFLVGDDFARRSGAVLLEDASVVAIRLQVFQIASPFSERMLVPRNRASSS